MVNLVSVLSATKFGMISEGLVSEHLYAIAATSLCFAGFNNGVQLTNLVFINSEGQNYSTEGRRGSVILQSGH